MGKPRWLYAVRYKEIGILGLLTNSKGLVEVAGFPGVTPVLRSSDEIFDLSRLVAAQNATPCIAMCTLSVHTNSRIVSFAY